MTTEEIGLFKLEKNSWKRWRRISGNILSSLPTMPSHITAPALHMTATGGRTLPWKLGIDYTEVPEELCAFARKRLRR
jgi:L-lactate utilization protein LutB